MEFVQQNMIWIGLALVSATMLVWPMLTGAGMESVSPGQATLLMNREDALVLDVRDSGEWSTRHIAGARHIALAQLDKRLSEIDKFKARPVIVCCATGSRSPEACGRLKKAGYEKVFSLSGGLAAWTEAGLPVTAKA